MIKKFFKFEENFSISRAAIIVGSLTLLSKFIALIRDPLFAYHFGGKNTYIWDAYTAAFRIPEFIMNIFVLGTLSVALVPVFVDSLNTDKQKAQKIANSIITLAMSFLIFIFVILFIFAKKFNSWLMPGFLEPQLLLVVNLSRIIILAQIIFSLSNICSNLLYSYKKFIIAGLAPIVYNFGIIFGLIFLYPNFGIMGLGFGVLLGAILHLTIQLPALKKEGFILKPIYYIKDQAVKKFWKLYLPRILVLDLSFFALLTSTYFASFFTSGSVALFSVAFNIQSVPISFIALSLSTAMFPALSEAYANLDIENFLRIFKKTAVQIFYFLLPISLCMIIFRAQGVRLYLGHGNFDWQNTSTTFNLVGILAFSILSQGLAPIFARAFYARKNTKTPVLINLFSMLVNVILVFLLTQKYQILGLAWAFSIASLTNAFLLFAILWYDLNQDLNFKKFLHNFDKELFDSLAKIILSSFVLGSLCYAGLYIIEPILNTHTVIGLFLQVTFAFCLGLFGFLITSYKLKLQETLNVITFLKKIF